MTTGTPRAGSVATVGVAVVIGMGIGLLVDSTPVKNHNDNADSRSLSRGSSVGDERRASGSWQIELLQCQTDLEEATEKAQAAEAELRFSRYLVDSLTAEAFGPRLEWPADIPEVMEPGAFQDNVERAFEQCNPSAHLLDVNCDEPPCLAVLEPTGPEWWHQLVNDCAPWSDAYSTAGAMVTREVECPDGTSTMVVVLSAPGVAKRLSDSSGQSSDAISKRIDYRALLYEGEVRCNSDD